MGGGAMENAEVSCLKTEEREFVLEAYGKNREEAVGTVFARLKKEVYRSVDGLILHMEPREVYLAREEEKTRAQKLLGFFAPREIQNHYIKLRVIVTVKYL